MYKNTTARYSIQFDRVNSDIFNMLYIAFLKNQDQKLLIKIPLDWYSFKLTLKSKYFIVI